MKGYKLVNIFLHMSTNRQYKIINLLTFEKNDTNFFILILDKNSREFAKKSA